MPCDVSPEESKAYLGAGGTLGVLHVVTSVGWVKTTNTGQSAAPQSVVVASEFFQPRLGAMQGNEKQGSGHIPFELPSQSMLVRCWLLSSEILVVVSSSPCSMLSRVFAREAMSKQSVASWGEKHNIRHVLPIAHVTAGCWRDVAFVAFAIHPRLADMEALGSLFIARLEKNSASSLWLEVVREAVITFTFLRMLFACHPVHGRLWIRGSWWWHDRQD